ncbi:MAG: ABC transporter ATP-binding protein [Candidatus Competibacterales bacterium]
MDAVDSSPLLTLYDLQVRFPAPKPHPLARRPFVHAVDGVSLTIPKGSAFGLVGESGSGKSTTAKAILRLVPIYQGEIWLGDVDLATLRGEALRQIRKRVQIIFQDPYASLNPRSRAGTIVREPLDRLELGTETERRARVAELFERVGLRPAQGALFPHQFSGGQRQRLGIARALAPAPDLIVCDEPVSALDVAIQAQILNLMARLQGELGLTYLFISHDLGVVQHLCDRVGVMYAGQLVEQGRREGLFGRPRHPYTWSLMSAVPCAHVRGRRQRVVLQGDPPSPVNRPPGCRFAQRCPFAVDRCRLEVPAWRWLTSDHGVACHRVALDGTPPHEVHAPAESAVG